MRGYGVFYVLCIGFLTAAAQDLKDVADRVTNTYTRLVNYSADAYVHEYYG